MILIKTINLIYTNIHILARWCQLILLVQQVQIKNNNKNEKKNKQKKKQKRPGRPCRVNIVCYTGSTCTYIS
jgi:hypothetical protein